MHYFVGIDETGGFNLATNKDSFAVAIVTKSDKSELFNRYKEIKLFESPQNINLKNYHSSDMSEDEKKKSFDILFSSVDKIIASTGRPPLASNQQHWWLSSIQAVLSKLFSINLFRKGDSVEIFLDSRNMKVVGWFSDDSIDPPDKEEYHSIIKAQLIRFLSKYIESGIQINIDFSYSNTSPYINLADLACGWVRDKRILETKLEKVSCRPIALGATAQSQLEAGKPSAALYLILSELYENLNTDLFLLQRVFHAIRKDKTKYLDAWGLTGKYIVELSERRDKDPTCVPKLQKLIEPLDKEYVDYGRQHLHDGIKLEYLLSRIIVDGHIGITESAAKVEYFKVFEKCSGDVDRSTIRWEKYVQAHIRSVQIQFNRYETENVIKEFEKLWGIQEKINTIPFPYQSSKTDETTSEITGTLGQAYSLNGEYVESLEYFKTDKEYAVKKSISMNKVNGYLFIAYHRLKDLDNAEKTFMELSENMKAEEIITSKKLMGNLDSWTTTNLFRLLALKAELGETITCPDRTLWDIPENKDYPWPLALKWAAYCAVKCAKNNEAIVLLEDGIKMLIANKSEFTIRALSLPLYQMLALIKNVDKKEYDELREQLFSECDSFKSYIVSKSPDLLKMMGKDKSLWDRAMSLPFYYA
jgi:hypothetical protein